MSHKVSTLAARVEIPQLNPTYVLSRVCIPVATDNQEGSLRVNINRKDGIQAALRANDGAFADVPSY